MFVPAPPDDDLPSVGICTALLWLLLLLYQKKKTFYSRLARSPVLPKLCNAGDRETKFRNRRKRRTQDKSSLFDYLLNVWWANPKHIFFPAQASVFCTLSLTAFFFVRHFHLFTEVYHGTKAKHVLTRLGLFRPFPYSGPIKPAVQFPLPRHVEPVYVRRKWRCRLLLWSLRAASVSILGKEDRASFNSFRCTTLPGHVFPIQTDLHPWSWENFPSVH